MKLHSLVTEDNKKLYWAFGLVAGSWVLCIIVSYLIWFLTAHQVQKQAVITPPAMKQFASESAFRTYIQTSSTLSNGYESSDLLVTQTARALSAPAELPAADTSTTIPERVSRTNVQVVGVDEPDIVKTDGKQLFVGGEQYGYYRTLTPVTTSMVAPKESSILPMPPLPQTDTHVITALPPEQASVAATIKNQGDLLLTDTSLIVINGGLLTGYNRTKTNYPETWTHRLAGNQSIDSTRLIGNSIILVTRTYAQYNSPCPIPLLEDKKTVSVACTDVWHPIDPVPVDSTYTVIVIDADSGDVQRQTSFVGSSGSSVVYVSPTAVYVSFTKTTDWAEAMTQFYTDPTNKLITESVREHIAQVMALSISNAAKQVEIQSILADYKTTMSDDDRLKWETDQQNLLAEYVGIHKRDMEKTTIAKVTLSDLRVAAMGEVPGRPLNQFSLDEYDNTFRIAVTVGGRGLVGNAKSANDVYVLDASMQQVGSVTDLGKEERIYAVRFMGKTGYVVTFKETDPLYVIDLSAPTAPKVAGELHIPGYSSYLHPLTDSLLLGIGKEESKVKLSLFDVSNPSQPTEVSHCALDEYWSQVLTTHHAFLQDADHTMFFMPGEKGGYVFSYKDKALQLSKAIDGTAIKRAVYINDTLYLVADKKVSLYSLPTLKSIKSVEW
jgi:uncharacterized secreted protein with C-terminal beta-propeller domain